MSYRLNNKTGKSYKIIIMSWSNCYTNYLNKCKRTREKKLVKMRWANLKHRYKGLINK